MLKETQSSEGMPLFCKIYRHSEQDLPSNMYLFTVAIRSFITGIHSTASRLFLLIYLVLCCIFFSISVNEGNGIRIHGYPIAPLLNEIKIKPFHKFIAQMGRYSNGFAKQTYSQTLQCCICYFLLFSAILQLINILPAHVILCCVVLC